MAEVELHEVTVRRGGLTLLDHVDLSIADGELVGVVGPSGAGKTTLLRVVAGLERPEVGAVDVPFGYPAGTAALLGLDVPGDAGARDTLAWRAMWSYLERTLDDDDRNRNDRFEVAAALNRRSRLDAGPFWGRPDHLHVDGLLPTKAPFTTVPEWRACEHELRRRGRRPSSVWQTAYAGSVGGQALTAIPVLERLRRRYAHVEVWPFTTGFVDPAMLAADAVVLAEVWPSAFAVDRDRHRVKDAAQVIHVVDELATADRRAELSPWFGAPDVSEAAVDAALREEGWILGPPAAH